MKKIMVSNRTFHLSSLNKKKHYCKVTHDFFQLVVTTAPETITHNIMRTIEAIYFFHPNAKVVVHTNTIPSRDSKFDIFQETGYNFEIAPYDFEEIFKQANFLTPEIGPCGFFLFKMH